MKVITDAISVMSDNDNFIDCNKLQFTRFLNRCLLQVMNICVLFCSSASLETIQVSVDRTILQGNKFSDKLPPVCHTRLSSQGAA